MRMCCRAMTSMWPMPWLTLRTVRLGLTDARRVLVSDRLRVADVTCIPTGEVSTQVGEVACPGCGIVSGRVHSCYHRQLLDTAATGRELLIQLRVWQIFCGNTPEVVRIANHSTAYIVEPQIEGSTHQNGGKASWDIELSCPEATTAPPPRCGLPARQIMCP
jgi:hypothetical protein